jgi:hypothetical protein
MRSTCSDANSKAAHPVDSFIRSDHNECAPQLVVGHVAEVFIQASLLFVDMTLDLSRGINVEPRLGCRSNHDQNFATVVMPYVQPGPAQIPQPLHVPARVPQPQPGAIVTPPKPQVPAKLILMIGPVTLNLSNGLSIEPQLLGSAGAGRGKNPIADIVSNPNDVTMLGLRNLSDRPYQATLISGKTVDLTNGQSVLLAPGIVIDFGGIKGVVQAG